MCLLKELKGIGGGTFLISSCVERVVVCGCCEVSAMWIVTAPEGRNISMYLGIERMRKGFAGSNWVCGYPQSMGTYLEVDSNIHGCASSEVAPSPLSPSEEHLIYTFYLFRNIITGLHLS